MAKYNKKIYRLLRFATIIIFLTMALRSVTYSLHEFREAKNEFIGESNTNNTRITLKVSKVWANVYPQNSHPDRVTVQLYRNAVPYGSSVTLSWSNSWTYTWTGLDKNYIWTADEINVPDGYIKTVSGGVNAGFVITNTYYKQNNTATPSPPPTAAHPPSAPPTHWETTAQTPTVTTKPSTTEPTLSIPATTQTTPTETETGTTDPTGDFGDDTVPKISLTDNNTTTAASSAPPDYSDFTDNNPPGNTKTPPDTDTPLKSAPKTGDDESDPRLWLATLGVSAFILRYALFSRKKLNDSNNKGEIKNE